VPQPEPSVNCVKTKDAGAREGVRTSREMQIEKVARTLMGANQRTMRCSVRVASEHIMPDIMRIRIERSTI
jgi:hypothetical protein